MLTYTEPLSTESYSIKEVNLNNFTNSLSIPVNVTGYWSQQTICIYLRISYYETPSLDVSVSHSTGGRDTEELQDELKASTNFGNALIAASNYAKHLKENEQFFLDKYNQYRADLKKEQELKQELKQAKIDGDLSISEDETVQIVNDMINEAKTAPNGIAINKFRTRGSDTVFTVQCTVYSSARFLIDEQCSSKKKVIQKIQESAEKLI